MKYYLFPLTLEESQNPSMKGWAYAIKNKSRWVDLGEAHASVDTYCHETTYFVYNDDVYYVHRDYTNINEQYRMYVGVQLNYSVDRV